MPNVKYMTLFYLFVIKKYQITVFKFHSFVNCVHCEIILVFLLLNRKCLLCVFQLLLKACVKANK